MGKLICHERTHMAQTSRDPSPASRFLERLA
jgi:hypothetical protein